MNFSGPYDPTAFHGISSLHDADKHFRSKNGLSFVETKLKSLILQHDVSNLFGVALVHRHFDLEEGTILVEKDMVTAPWKCDISLRSIVGGLSRSLGSSRRADLTLMSSVFSVILRPIPQNSKSMHLLLKHSLTLSIFTGWINLLVSVVCLDMNPRECWSAPRAK